MLSNELKLVYVNNIGKNSLNYNIYDLYFTDEPELVWGEMWEQKPSGICGDMTPIQASYQHIVSIATQLNLDLAQNNLCFSMQDCIDNIVALAWENIDGYDEYPDDRIVFHFGNTIEDVRKKLYIKNIEFNE